MEEQSMKLLEECSKGCKMGIDSIEQVKTYMKDDNLAKVVAHYNEIYKNLDDEVARLLMQDGEPEKEPGKMAVAFSWITTEMKLMIKDDSGQIAKLMMDGCNMGIQSIGKVINENPEASKQARAVAEKLVKALEDYMKDLKQFL